MTGCSLRSFLIRVLVAVFTFLSILSGTLTPAYAQSSLQTCRSIFEKNSKDAGVNELDTQVEAAFEQAASLQDFTAKLQSTELKTADQAAAPESAAEDSVPDIARRDLRADYEQSLALISNTTRPTLSIVIPAYNEAKRLPQSLEKIRAFFNSYPFPVEILVIVEKSTDQTVQLAQNAVAGDTRFQVIDNQVQRGKGFAVRSGMKRATGKYVLFMDADLSTPLPEIYRFLKSYNHDEASDIRIGNRRDANGRVEEKSLGRRIMSRIFQKITSLVGISGVADTQCGFKMFTQAASKDIFAHQQLNGFAFDVEVLVLADELGYQVTPINVEWADSPNSKVNPLVDPFRMLWDMLKIRKMVRTSLRAETPHTALQL
jgi:dolichyl-phosphate beta-glucosyltransferase